MPQPGDRDFGERPQQALVDLQFGEQLHVAVFVDAPAEGLLDHVGLLEDLFEHEMLEAVFLGRRSVPRDLLYFALDRMPVERGQTIAARSTSATSPSCKITILRVY